MRNWFRGITTLAFATVIGAAFAPGQPAFAQSSAATIQACYKVERPPGAASQIVAACNEAVNAASLPNRKPISVRQAINANFHLGRALAETGQLREALEALQRVLVLDRNNVDAKLQLADVLRRGREFAPALTLLDEISRMQTGQISPLLADTLFIRAMVYLDRSRVAPQPSDRADAVRDLSDAIRIAESTARIDPKRSAAVITSAKAMLGDTARELGEAALREPVDMESSQRALDLFRRANQADPNNTGVMVGLGLAELRMAGFNGRLRVGDFNCARGDGEGGALDRAGRYFSEALTREPGNVEAHYGLGCVYQAVGNYDQAIAQFQAAAGQQVSDPRFFVALARAYVAAGRPADAEASFNQAIGRESDPRKRAPIYAAIARAYMPAYDPYKSPPDFPDNLPASTFAGAVRNFTAAINAEKVYAKPYLELGRIYLYLKNYPLARENLRNAEYYGNTVEYANDRAEALYMLSKLETVYMAGGSTQAINDADNAVAMRDIPLYRDHACLIRVRYGRVGAGDDLARLHCAARNNRQDPNSLLLEGMFHLRRADFVDNLGGDQKRAWEDAYRTFSEALAIVSPNNALLKARLEFGQGLALYCVGFATSGRETIGRAGPLLDAATAFFADYKISTCDRLDR
jgi:tetratricopeptide (TPR) repeat protein